MTYLLFGCRCLIGVVFLTSVIGKVRGRSAFDAFVSSIEDLRLIPALWSRSLAYGVVCAEAAVVGLLAVPGAVVPGFALSCVLLAAFSAAILAAVRTGVRAPCRCFGASVTPLGLPHVVRNLVLLASAVTGGLIALRPPAGASHPAGIAVGLLAAVVMAAPLVFVFDDFVALFTEPSTTGSPPSS